MASEDPSSSEVVYLGHIPHGFFEPQIKKYFGQFGLVRKIRLCRNKKTGKSKCYGFIKFASVAVAKAASEAMDNYLMFNKILKCINTIIIVRTTNCSSGKMIPKEKIPPKLFKGSEKVFTRSLWPSINASRHNRQKTPESDDKRRKRMMSKIAIKNKKLTALGINYSFAIPSQSDEVNSDVKDELKEELNIDDDSKIMITDSFQNDVSTASLYSMHMDSTDDEVCFTTPPNAIKVKRIKSTSTKK